MEHLPSGGALLVYYHGAIPLDFYYICSHVLLYTGRLVNPVGDRFLFKSITLCQPVLSSARMQPLSVGLTCIRKKKQKNKNIEEQIRSSANVRDALAIPSNDFPVWTTTLKLLWPSALTDVRPRWTGILFAVPGWASLLEAFGVIPGTVQSCAALLKKGKLLAIAPGGVYEAQLGDNTYQLLWRQRKGFAKVAIEAQVVETPILLFCFVSLPNGTRSTRMAWEPRKFIAWCSIHSFDFGLK